MDMTCSYCMECGYNIRLNAENNFGWRPSKETRELWSKQRIGKVSPRKGVIVSEETKRKMSIANTGRRLSQNWKDNISKGMKGKQNSLGCKATPERRNKIANKLLKHKPKVKVIERLYIFGSSNGMAKLNEQQARIIIKLLEFNFMTLKEIANCFNVSFQLISQIKLKKAWRYLWVI